MSQVYADCRWGVLGHSQQGASHVRQDLPNQDAIEHSVAEDGLPPVILAVADGHGSARSFRSDIGARLAVKTAIEACQVFLDGIRGASPPLALSQVKNAAEQQIPRDIFRNWRESVAVDLAEKPFTKEELDRLADQVSAEARDRAARGELSYIAYGSTLLMALLTDEFLLCFQLGDGDILAVYDATGEVGRVIPKDDTLIANETTSLCQEECVRYFRCKIKQLNKESPPALVLLSTDGYCNSFATPDAFLKVGNDYLEMLHTDGVEAVEKSLPEWLDDTSRNGSGDDISVGIIYRLQPPPGEPESKQAETESPAADASVEQAVETKAASDAVEEAAGSALPVSESPAGSAAEQHAPGLVSNLLRPLTFFFSKHRGKPGGTES